MNVLPKLCHQLFKRDSFYLRIFNPLNILFLKKGIKNCTWVWWGLWNFIVQRVKFNWHLHHIEPKRKPLWSKPLIIGHIFTIYTYFLSETKLKMLLVKTVLLILYSCTKIIFGEFKLTFGLYLKVENCQFLTALTQDSCTGWQLQNWTHRNSYTKWCVKVRALQQ